MHLNHLLVAHPLANLLSGPKTERTKLLNLVTLSSASIAEDKTEVGRSFLSLIVLGGKKREKKLDL